MDNLIYIINVAIAITIFIGLVYWRNLDAVLKIIIIQSTFALITHLCGRAYKIYHPGNNIFIYNIYIFIELFLMSLIGLKLIGDKAGKVFFIIGVCLCGLIDCISIGKHGINTLASWGYLSESILVTALFLFAFINMIITEHSIIVRNPQFWYCIGMLIYYGCIVPVYSFNNYLIEHNVDMAGKIFNINDIALFIRYICISIALLMQRRAYLKTQANYE